MWSRHDVSTDEVNELISGISVGNGFAVSSSTNMEIVSQISTERTADSWTEKSTHSGFLYVYIETKDLSQNAGMYFTLNVGGKSFELILCSENYETSHEGHLCIPISEPAKIKFGQKYRAFVAVFY